MKDLASFSIRSIDHAVEYVNGSVHTNTMENQAFRYNNRRGMDDSERYDLAVRQIVGNAFVTPTQVN